MAWARTRSRGHPWPEGPMYSHHWAEARAGNSGSDVVSPVSVDGDKLTTTGRWMALSGQSWQAVSMGHDFSNIRVRARRDRPANADYS